MKKYLVIFAGCLLFASTAAMADPPWQHGDHGNHGNDDGDHHGKHGRHDDGDHSDDHDRRGGGDYDRGERVYYVRHDRGRHEGWYKRGGRVPEEYRESRYVVTDWRRDDLREPPRGYHWVRSDDGDFLLVAVATGVIADLLLHH